MKTLGREWAEGEGDYRTLVRVSQVKPATEYLVAALVEAYDPAGFESPEECQASLGLVTVTTPQALESFVDGVREVLRELYKL